MKIGIIAAMSKELNLLLPLIENRKATEINGTVYHTGVIGHHDVVAAQSGIGKVNAAIAALTLIEAFKPDLVINSGVAGGAGPAGVLDLVIPDRIAYHDVWCGPGTVPGQAADCPLFFECALPAGIAERLNARRGVLASGDIFVSKPEEVERIVALYPDAVAVDMESAAIAQVCYKKGVPFICVRVVSDTPGKEDNIAQYESFWDDAPKTTFEALTRLLSLL